MRKWQDKLVTYGLLIVSGCVTVLAVVGFVTVGRSLGWW